MDRFDIKGTVQTLFDDSGMLDILLGIEEYFDNSDLYVFANWIKGEVVEGPIISKYWVEVTLKYNMDEVPDPRGAFLFQNQGTKIYVRRDVEEVPLKYARDQNELDSETMKVNIEEIPVLLVKFIIPRRLVDASSVTEYQLLDDDIQETDVTEVPQEQAPEEAPLANVPPEEEMK